MLTDSEIARIKFELGYNVLTFDAEPYIGIVSVFETVIKRYVSTDGTTTSSTTVTASTNPTPTSITLASAIVSALGPRLVVDVDDRQEIATVSAVSGSTVVLLLKKAHSGTYPVSIESGETLVREQLAKIAQLDAQLIARLSSAGIKKVDEIEFFGAPDLGGLSASEAFQQAKDDMRDELAAMLGVPNLRETRGNSRTMEAY